MMAGLLVTSIGSGQLISRFGRYKPFPIAGTLLMTVGLLLLSRLQVDTSTLVTSLYMLVLGLGLGLVMQVLVLATQNAVDYKYLGVATSGSTLFRQIGGSIGVAAFGAIFANQLKANLAGKLPPGSHTPAALDPAEIKLLPPLVHRVVVAAITDALHPVFLTAAGIAFLGFLLSWALPEVTLRRTAEAPAVGDGLDPSRDDSALRELERALSKLAGREERWQLYERLARRAGVELEPPELWLLARLGERAPLTEMALDEQLPVDPVETAAALEELESRSLVERGDGSVIVLTRPGREDYERLVAARQAGLHELLDGWNPDQHRQLQELVDKLSRDLVSEVPTPSTTR
jgi:DNA-binding MarR family transcriptional regulator